MPSWTTPILRLHLQSAKANGGDVVVQIASGDQDVCIENCGAFERVELIDFLRGKLLPALEGKGVMPDAEQ